MAGLKLLRGVIATLFLLVAGPLCAQPPGGAPLPPPSPLAAVELSPEQQRQVRQLMAQERTAHQARVERMHQAQRQLQQLYQQPRWDIEAISQAFDTIQAEQRATIRAMARAHNRVYDLLDENQRRQWQQKRPPMPQQMR